MELALDIPGVYLKGNTRLYYDPKQKKYLPVRFSCGLCNVFATETGKTEKHTGEKKYCLLFKFFEKVSVIFIANVFNLRLNASIPDYYRLSDGDQDIIRAVRWQRRTAKYCLMELARLAGLKPTNNVTLLKKALDKRLEKVKKVKGIRSWKVKGKGVKTHYELKY